MVRARPIPEGRECNHTCCSSTCHREPSAPKVKKPIKRYSAKPKESDPELEAFFANCYDIIARNPRCAECGDWIPPNLYRFATAHILPKAIFKSVRTHPLIWLQLGSLCGCHEKTHRLDTFSKMKVFKFAVERFKIFEPEIKEKHDLLNLFKQYAENYLNHISQS